MKEYLDRKLSRVNRTHIGKLVRNAQCLVAPPTIGLDLYSLDQLHSYSKKRYLNSKAILDNNVVSGMLRVVTQNGPISGPFDDETRKICGIAAYLIYGGIEIVPEFAIYEDIRATDPSSRQLNDYILRIVDHLHPQVLADISTGKLCSIPDSCFQQAKLAVDTNNATQHDITAHNYEDEKQPGIDLAYTKLMYAWLQYKNEEDPEIRLNEFLDWSYSNSLATSSFDLFVAAFLSHNRLGKMIKDVNTNDSSLLLKNIRNVSWDLFYLGSLHLMIDASNVPTTWCFVTRDKLLTEIGPYLFQMQTDVELHEFAERFFKIGTFPMLKAYKQKVDSRPHLDLHTVSVQNSMQNIIANLEYEIEQVLR